jgi:site-specific DNA recombinase
MKTAAIYARVSSDQQKEEKTIASQTAALMEFARIEGYGVPAEWIFQDEGYSGANLVRPGLERVRDLAAEGQIQAVLVLSPDRLSRKYAYQVLLIEELVRHGVQVVFVNAPKSDSPEDQLLLQFQGMIAEYERAQILERSRRGKRHRARHGEISVLSGAPYGYRYVRKSDERAGYYEVIEAEADVVRQAYAWYTREGLSIGGVTRRLNELSVPTKKQGIQWERSTVWAMLRNPAYKGTACFGKTQTAARQRTNTRALRQRGSLPARVSASHELPREQWIGIAVPALIEVDTFDAAQERLASNKQRSSRRTIEPSVLQGLVHCQECGYALYRTSTRSSARKIYYYRCLGSDAWRYSGKARCDERPIRQDLLDHIVWTELVRLIEDPTLIQAELSRRLEAARNAIPAKRRQETLMRELAQTRKRMERLLTAYQEELLSLDELRRRMPELRRREQSLQTELEALRTQVADQGTYLRLAQTLSTFLDSLRANVKTLDVLDRQRIARLLLKEVVVGHAHIIIRHSIPNTIGSSGGSPGRSYRPRSGDGATSDSSYPLCPWTERPALRRALRPRAYHPVCHHARFQIPADEAKHLPVTDLLRDLIYQ